MLHDGSMTPETIYPDIPSHFGAYNPKNFDESYSGAVKANKVISKSLNIPSVHMLQQYGISKFADKLRKLGMTTLHNAASHYGLTLILGGAETSLWDLGAMYA
jgi:penicillin-binding protein 1C